MEFWLTNSLRQEPPACVAEREMGERTGRATETRVSPSRAPVPSPLGPYDPTTATPMKTSLKIDFSSTETFSPSYQVAQRLEVWTLVWN